MARRLLRVTAALGLLVVAVLVVLVAAYAAVPLAIVAASAALALAVGVRSRFIGRQARGRVHRGSRRAHGVWQAAVPARADPPGPIWTMTWEMILPPSEVAAVRRRAGAVLAEWGIDGDAAQPTLLVITELLTNAVVHASAPIHLTLEWGHTFVRVQLHDSAPGAPRTHDRHPGVAGGRGLQIVDGLALRRGWTPEQHGKTVWADVPTDWPTQRPDDGPPHPLDQ